MKARFLRVWLAGMLSALDMHCQDEVIMDVEENEEGFAEYHSIEQDGKIIPRSEARETVNPGMSLHDEVLPDTVDAGSLMKLSLGRLQEICEELVIPSEGLKKAELVNAILAKKAESPE